MQSFHSFSPCLVPPGSWLLAGQGSKSTASSKLPSTVPLVVGSGLGSRGAGVSLEVASVSDCVASAVSGGVQPSGGSTLTMLWHLGHARIWPIAARLCTFNRARQVVHVIENVCKAFARAEGIVRRAQVVWLVRFMRPSA